MDSTTFGRVAAAALISCALGATFFSSQDGTTSCPAGYRPAKTLDGETGCVSRKLPESFSEVAAREAAVGAGRAGATGETLRRAVEQKKAMAPLKAKVANASQSWSPWGQGPQVADPAFPDGSADGIPEVAGRADHFAYDAEARRLFVAIGNGGIWMSEAVDGDLATLGDHWVSISDNMPTLVNSAVAWTPASGGRVIALSGDHVQGGNTYVGLGAFWSDDLGATWHQATGAPDGASSGKLAVDPAYPNIVYAATGRGLFRSDDAGETFVNVALPVSSECAGVVTGTGACQLASVVTDVAVQSPGGVTNITCSDDGCPVIAAVGYRSGALPYADGKPQAPGNGIYRSTTGVPGSFERVGIQTPTGLAPVGFAPQERIGRIELGLASGPAQDHNYVFAMVQDAALLNGNFPFLDLPIDNIDTSLACLATGIVDPTVEELCLLLASDVPSPTNLNGIYVSPDFGETWIRIVDDTMLMASGVAGGSSLVAAAALGVGPGAQAWYNTWIKPDPTQALPATGQPTRVAFGLEEIWENRVPLPPLGAIENTPLGWHVFGTYFAGNTCLFLLGNAGLPSTPVCPFRDGLLTNTTTTHPDQHDGLFIPDEENGGVWLFAANDGGVYKQYSADPLTDPFVNTDWGNGANHGFYTLMNYGIGVAKDGTVYYGLQDNASGKIEGDTRRQVRVYIGDGVYAAVDPDNSQIAYYQTPGLSIVKTTDGGMTNAYVDPGSLAGAAHFLSPFAMDRLDANHLVAAGSMVAETIDAGATWTTSFDLGMDEESGLPHQSRSRALDVEGDASYVGWCGPCNVNPGTLQFQRGIATNVGGDLPPKKGAADGWHQATAAGLPNRYVYGIEIDPADAETVYVVLGDYSTARWLPAGQYLDQNTNIGTGRVFKSTDAGESFTDITGNLPDVVTTAILKVGQQLVVGTDIGVFISSDLQGTEWAPLGDLPNVPVNQLVLHPGDVSTVLAGTFGRGVQSVKLTEVVGETPVPGPGSRTEQRFGGALPLALLAMLFGAALYRRRRF
jgi:hypothetical protein